MDKFTSFLLSTTFLNIGLPFQPGCCGVLAAVEAYLIKCLLFDPGVCKFKEPLRANQTEVMDAFIHALSYILWQAGDFQKGAVIM